MKMEGHVGEKRKREGEPQEGSDARGLKRMKRGMEGMGEQGNGLVLSPMVEGMGNGHHAIVQNGQVMSVGGGVGGVPGGEGQNGLASAASMDMQTFLNSFVCLFVLF